MTGFGAAVAWRRAASPGKPVVLLTVSQDERASEAASRHVTTKTKRLQKDQQSIAFVETSPTRLCGCNGNYPNRSWE